jgi:hypothetical protein
VHKKFLTLFVSLCLLLALVGSFVPAAEAATGAQATVALSSTNRRLDGTFTCTSPTDIAAQSYSQVVQEWYVNTTLVHTDTVPLSPPQKPYSSGTVYWDLSTDLKQYDTVKTKTICTVVAWNGSAWVFYSTVNATSTVINYSGFVSPQIEQTGGTLYFKCLYKAGPEAGEWDVFLFGLRNWTEVTSGLAEPNPNAADQLIRTRETAEVWSEGDEMKTLCTLWYRPSGGNWVLKSPASPEYAHWPQ